MRTILFLAAILLGLIAACTNEAPCPGLDPFCDRSAKAKFKVSPSLSVAIGDTLVVKADDSIFDELYWYWDDLPIGNCNGEDSCRITVENMGEFKLKIRAKVNGSIMDGESQDTHEETIYVSEFSSHSISLEDHFSNGSIDYSVWNANDVDPRISVQGNQLHMDGSVNTTYNAHIRSYAGISEGVVVAQSYFYWNGSGSNETHAGLRLYGSDNNFAQINSGGNNYELVINKDGSNVYTQASGISFQKNVKVTYDIDSKEIEFWYWSNQWVQMGTTQTFDLGSHMNVDLNLYDDSGLVDADNLYFDDVYFTQGNYSTSFP